ncbi:polysaccharide pyruvyl transferase family protein [Prosthecobacter fluviatilis]|uniref:Polysaccharide pyruvyl transferase family protein n=1 Tax=Prosthecobacter fluviatilis TaxID=445931 RepID=A0ABW0KS48_9BACT
MTTRRHFISSITAALGGSVFAADGRPKTILLQSAWDTVNIGDIGHTPGTLRVIEEHLPEVKVVLWAMKLDERVTAMLKKRFPKVEILQGSLTGKSERDEALRQAISNCDLYIRNSGMGQDVSFMQFCQKVGRPYGLFGQSYFASMVEGKGAEERTVLLNNASFIYTRETKTLSILKSHGIKTPVLEFGPDGCFGIDVRDDERGSATMKKLGLEEKKFITVQIRTNTPKYPGVDDPRPEKLNPLHPTPQQIADDERRAAKYRELVTMWVKKTGHKVLIAPETIKEMGHNKRLIHDLLPPEIQKHVVNLEYFWNADEAASIFARAHTIVCHEPHSPIIALANGTPIIHTYSEFHSPKCWMFKDIGLGEWLLEMDETPVEKMAETLFAIDADYPAAQAKVKKAMAYVHECFGKSMQHVKGVLAKA